MSSEAENYREPWALETIRKERLLCLFEKFEAAERELVRSLPLGERKYTRKINDHGVVKKIAENFIIWVRENGEKLNIPLDPEICKHLRKEDVLLMNIGKRAQAWRVLFLGVIASPVKSDKPGTYSISGKPPHLLN
jgi:hypothetical protein